MVELAANIWADGPSSDPYEPKKEQIRAWGAWVEGIITAFTSSGGLIYSSKTALDADLSKAANSMAWVIGDPVAANNGVYGKVGASGTGSWTRRSDLPFSFIIASDAGAGTPNAIQATTAIPVSGSALIWMNVADTNTTTPVTVSFNGGSALTIKSNSGEDVEVGGLQSGMILLGVVSGSTFRLFSDETIAAKLYAARDAAVAAQAAAEAAEAAAEAARDIALDAAGDTVAQGSVPIFNSRDTAATFNLVAFSTVIVNKWSSASAVAPAHYVKVAQPGNVEPTSPAKFQSADGYWFALDEDWPSDLMFGDGTAAIDRAAAHGTLCLKISKRSTYSITANYSTPVDMVLDFERGAYFTVDAAAELYVRGIVSAYDDDHIWRGTGAVKGLTYATTAHFGMVNNYNASTGTGADCAPMLQRAINALANSSLDDRVNKWRSTFKALSGQFLLGSTVQVPIDEHHGIRFIGAGTEIDGTRFWSTHAGICLHVLRGSLTNVSDFELRDFCLEKVNGHLSAVNEGTGLKLGEDDDTLSGLGYRLVENVRAEYFNTNFNYTNARNVVFKRCRASQTQANRSNMVIRSRNDLFCGEVFLEDFVFDYPPAGVDGPNLPDSFNLQIDAAGTQGIRQVIMRNINGYRGQSSVFIQAQDNSGCGEIVYDGSALDGSNGEADYTQMLIYAGNNAIVDGVRIYGGYLAGAKHAFRTSGPGTVNGVMIMANQFWYMARQTILFQAAHHRGINIIGNDFKNVVGTADATVVEEAIYFEGDAKGISVMSNSVNNNTALLQYFVRFTGACDEIVTFGNSGNWTVGEVYKDSTGLRYIFMSAAALGNVVIAPTLLPTSSAGLGSGAIWRDSAAGNVLKVVP
ncbi:hypothetical protein [Sinorhizobium sp. M4_45]|uniref:hypothetical protein n=1 Tax=Sinorhizobium sp. M4_45 TaxID=2037901 RepID=UPI0015E12A86|nr:hypothetical protein [Sinorhizobium sp. M4_45]